LFCLGFYPFSGLGFFFFFFLDLTEDRYKLEYDKNSEIPKNCKNYLISSYTIFHTMIQGSSSIFS